jgi:hypothetical protein
VTVFKFEIFVLLANIIHPIMWVEYSVEWVGYALDDQAIVVQFLAGERDFSLFQRVYTGSGTNPAYCPKGTVGHTSRDKANGECNYHSPQSSAELRMSGAVSLLPHAFTLCTGTILTSAY